MQIHHLQHLARAASGITNEDFVIFGGLASIIRTLANPSPSLEERLEAFDIAQILVSDNIDPEASNQLLLDCLGPESAFYARYGYGLQPCISWQSRLPTNWTKRLLMLNLPLRHGPQIAVISPTDLVLSNMLNGVEPLVNLELVQSGAVEVDELRNRLENWTGLSSRERFEINIQIQSIALTVTAAEGRPAKLPAIPPFSGAAIPHPTESVEPSETGNIVSIVRARKKANAEKALRHSA